MEKVPQNKQVNHGAKVTYVSFDNKHINTHTHQLLKNPVEPVSISAYTHMVL